MKGLVELVKDHAMDQPWAQHAMASTTPNPTGLVSKTGDSSEVIGDCSWKRPGGAAKSELRCNRDRMFRLSEKEVAGKQGSLVFTYHTDGASSLHMGGELASANQNQVPGCVEMLREFAGLSSDTAETVGYVVKQKKKR